MTPALDMESDAVAQSPARPVAEVPASRQLFWQLRREIGEYCSVWIAPLSVAPVLILGYLVGIIGRSVLTADLAEKRSLLEEPPHFVAMILMATAFLVAVFYCLDTLYGERRDRSILFWKSLPVSDHMTVLAKAAVPVVVIPVVTFAVTVVTQFVILIIGSFALSSNGFDVAPLWDNTVFVESSAALLFHLIGIHGFWYAPIFAWLLFVSAWAKRMPFVWAILPPAVLVAVEKLEFHTNYIGALLAHRFSGGPFGELFGEESMHPVTHLQPLEFLFSPGLWLGLAVAAGLLLLAARTRSRREPG